MYSKATIAAAQTRAAEVVRQRVQSARPAGPGMIERLCWLLALVSAGFGMIQLIVTMVRAESAPQQGAGAAMAVALAVIPYCIARAVQLGSRRE